MFIKPIAYAVAGSILWSPVAFAAPKQVTIACAPNTPSGRNWVPKAILIKIDAEKGTAAVLDDYTLQVFKSGVSAKIERPTPDRIKLDWKLVGVRNKQDRKQNVAFKMTINTKRMTFNYSTVADTQWVGAGNSHGRCLPVNAKS